MSAKVNRGKDFEEAIRNALKSSEDCAHLRLTDSTMGFAGVANPCDFIAYSYPHIYFLECKSCYGNTLPFANITKHQRESLSAYTKIRGVVSGYIIWFINHDRTVFINADDLDAHELQGYKSINIKDILNNTIPFIEIIGKKKRILFEYDLSTFFEESRNLYEQY